MMVGALVHPALALAAALAAAQAQFPVRVGDGPLLCVTTNAVAERRDEVTLHVVDLAGTGLALPVWRSRDNAKVLARLDRDRLLLASYGSPYALVVLDLPGGTHRVLADGCPHEFVAVHGSDVLHLGDPRGGAPDNFLYATPWSRPGERRRLAATRFARVGQLAGNLAVAIADDEASVWTVSVPNADSRLVWTPPAGAGALRVALSPGGQRLAIGCVQAGDGKGLLTVVDLGSAAVVRSWADLPIQVSPFSSSTPCLEVGWHDDAEVLCSESRSEVRGLSGNFVFVRRRLADGVVSDETTYAVLGLSHRAPPPPAPATAAPAATFFSDEVLGVERLWRAGAKEPLATFRRGHKRWDDLRIAADGQSAIAHLGERQSRCTLFTATSEQGRLLLEGCAYDATWLPAAAPVGPGGR